MRGIVIDAEAGPAAERWAVVYAPRRTRGRFPEASVEVVASEAAARAAADPAARRYAARVAGPARSSEGLNLYYLVRWVA